MKKIAIIIVLVTSLSNAAFAADPATSNKIKDPASVTSVEKDLTAQDQPFSKEETLLIANIRRALVKQEKLSIRAQNVTIVAQGPSKVFLRGEVASLDEKKRVLETAKQFATTVEESLAVTG